MPLRARLWTTLLALTTLLSSSACTPSTTPASSCGWVRVVRTDPRDVLVPATARQILAHNHQVEAVCGPGHGVGR